MTVQSSEAYRKRQQELRQESDRLYDLYGKSLEAEHWGEYVAIARDGRLLLGKDRRNLTRDAKEVLGPGSFMFKVGSRVVGRM